MSYLIILDYSMGEIVKIELSKEEQEVMKQYDDAEDYVASLEEEYDFRLKDCYWMMGNILSERSFFR